MQARVLNGDGVAGVRALVVDDEADQVSLNTRIREGSESAT